MSVLALPVERLMTPKTLLVFLAVLLVWSPQAIVNGRRTLRENAGRVASLTGYRWSSWYTALVPGPIPSSRNYERRDYGNYGFIVSSIRWRFTGKKYDDGIYELSVMKNGGKRYVVYIGSAYRSGPGSISQRILEYCRNGSHKRMLINRALRLGYKLFVRAQSIPGSRRSVRAYEDKYLAKYDYAWNQISNRRIRGNVPP